MRVASKLSAALLALLLASQGALGQWEGSGGSGGGAVSSVAGKTGDVTLGKGDVGLSNVDNTSDAAKPVSTAASAALALKAPLASPALTGTPTAPTAAAGTNTTQLATTAHVFAERANTATLTNKTLTAPTLSGTVAGTYTIGGTPTFPSSVVLTTGAQTLASKTLTAPVLSGTITGTYTLGGTPTIAQSGVTNLTSDLAARSLITDSATNTSTATGAQFARDMVLTYNPASAPSQTIPFARRDQAIYATSQTNTGAGHIAANISWFSRTGTGNPVLAIAHEAKFENNQASGTVSFGKGYESQLAANAGTINVYQGVNSQIIGNAGTVNYFRAFNADIPAAMTGTIGEYVGYYHPSVNKTGITTAWSFKNDDAGAPILSAAPIIDNSVYFPSTPTDGFSITIPDKVTQVYMYPAGPLGSGTITMPANPLDGQRVYFWSNNPVTTLTVAFNGKSNYGTVTSLPAYTRVGFQYLSALTVWQRIDAPQTAVSSPMFSTSTTGIGWQSDAYLGRTTDGVGLVLGSKSTVYNYSTANINGGGHIVGTWSGAYNNTAGKTLGWAIGAENTIGNQAGTVTKATSSFNTLNENASGATLTEWVGSQSEPTNNAGTITSAKAFQATLPGTGTNTGTISAWTAFDVPDASSSGVSTRFAFNNQDPGAAVKSKTPFADSSVYIPSPPTSGGTVTVPANNGTVVINSGASIANLTLAMPSSPPDGQCVTFFFVYPVTGTLTISAPGTTPIGAPATVAGSGFFTLKYTSQGPYWLRIG